MPSLLHRRAVVGLIVADLLMSVGVFAAIAANAAVSLPPESSLWSRLAPTLDLAVLNLVRGLALVWLVVKGWLPVSPTTLTMSTALYAAGKSMSLLTSTSATTPTSLISLYTCYSFVLPLVESVHLRAALASFASRRSSVTPSTMTPPTPIRASTMPSTSSSSVPGGETRYASHRSSRRAQRPAVTTATFSSGANRPLLDEADSRDYRTFLGAPPTAKQVARAAQRRDSMGPGEGEAGSAAAHRQHQVQQALQQQQQSRRLIRAPWLSDILAGITGHRPIPPPPPPPPPPQPTGPHASLMHDDWGRSRSHSHSGALLSPRSHALAFGHAHAPIHHYTSLADPPLQRSRRPNSGLMHPPSLNPARWSLATFDSADLARLSSAVQPWATHYTSVESAPQPSLRHPPDMNSGVDEGEGDGQSTMRAVRAQSSASSSTYDSEAEDGHQGLESPRHRCPCTIIISTTGGRIAAPAMRTQFHPDTSGTGPPHYTAFSVPVHEPLG
ncbi:hypothetical protein BCR44DRAFT_1205930 [Catenaria anguillulae PL171]|uniref:Uncharacterized protein n=1 Tax=Catenaria anguillulae PL171 TaxID=765915 RepID=A0A1Y2HF98_9FUNG|nr:hypothetical protein BCR44DRAFT_1205930 [Catenaria anguillulae PL171]